MATIAGAAALPLADSPLGRTVATTDTDIWNDSCAIDELEYALSYGAVGATANPTIVVDVWKKDPAHWKGRVQALATERPTATPADLAWTVVEEMSIRGARLLEPVFETQAGRQGRLSVQTDPTFFRSPDRMVEQAVGFDAIAPNIIVKLPATAAGVEAIEEATWRGISVNVTVSFTVAQAVTTAEAIERGLRRRDAAGLDTARMGPVVTLMMGRIEDWLRVVVDRDGLAVDPDALPWSGVAVFKRAYAEFRARGLRARLLGAAIRHHYHWSELIGGDVVITMPSSWQKRFNASDIEVRPRIDDPVPAAHLDALRRHLPDFVRAYEPDGLAVAEFDGFGATARTLRAFIASYAELLGFVTDALIPNPDKAR
ncbi:MAG TPA: transaldolase family protein [Candidatus Limnocylindrales bacterium]|nr:transaldolase family protein [Candidatus Limnocylindrales bacterium]